MQGLMILAIIGTEEDTLVFNLTQNVFCFVLIIV